MDSQTQDRVEAPQEIAHEPKSGLITKIAVVPVMALNVAMQLALFRPESGHSKEELLVGLATKIALAALIGPMVMAWLIGFNSMASKKYSFLTLFLFSSLVVLVVAFNAHSSLPHPQ